MSTQKFGADLNTISPSSATFSSSVPAVATISGSTATGVSGGTTSISAIYLEVTSSSASLRVFSSSIGMLIMPAQDKHFRSSASGGGQLIGRSAGLE